MASNDPWAANSLGAMKTRIADEIARDDLGSQIANAINDAISAYNNERFYFNESRTLLFPTVAGQDIYTDVDLPDMDNILKIDYIQLIIGNYPYRLNAEIPEEIDALSVPGLSVGQPYLYCWYQQRLRLYPAPMQTGWTVRIAAVIQAPPPPDDSTQGNVWMCDCERLIRSRAKYELAVHVTNDAELAAAMGGPGIDDDGNPTAGQISEALKSLRSKTKRLTQIGGGGYVRPMQF